jgi:hypothetical protein
VEESALITPDYLRPSQWRDAHRSTAGDDAPIKRLMLAILEISLRDATGARDSTKANRKFRLSPSARAQADAQRSSRARTHAIDALNWIADDGGEGPFTFENVCDVPGIDAERLRARLRECVDLKQAA